MVIFASRYAVSRLFTPLFLEHACVRESQFQKPVTSKEQEIVLPSRRKYSNLLLGSFIFVYNARVVKKSCYDIQYYTNVMIQIPCNLESLDVLQLLFCICCACAGGTFFDRGFMM